MPPNNKEPFDLFGNPYSEPQSVLERVFVRPSASARAMGYYYRFRAALFLAAVISWGGTLYLLWNWALPGYFFFWNHSGPSAWGCLGGALVASVWPFMTVRFTYRYLSALYICRKYAKAGYQPPASIAVYPPAYDAVLRHDPNDPPQRGSAQY